MKTLLLLRHAKSSWATPQIQDFDRPLNDRGKRAAAAMGAFMRASVSPPDLVLCSPARRTQETLEILREKAGWTAPVRTESPIYQASARTLIQCLTEIDGNPRNVMVIGHNPGIAELALWLAAAGEPAEFKELATKYPTGALAEIELPHETWSEIGARVGRLVRFVRPRSLSD